MRQLRYTLYVDCSDCVYEFRFWSVIPIQGDRNINVNILRHNDRDETEVLVNRSAVGRGGRLDCALSRHNFKNNSENADRFPVRCRQWAHRHIRRFGFS